MRSILRSKLFLAVVALGVVVLIGLQFVRPELTHPPVTADLQAPGDVKQIFVTACYNCHSNETKLSWFDEIVPGYWLVVSDVNKARKHVNFSEFGKIPAGVQAATLFEAINQVQLGAMPPAQYKMLHPESVLSPEQMRTIKNYLKTLEPNKPSDAAQIAAANDEYDKWIATGSKPATGVSPTESGFPFPADYKDWRPLSTTDREDNGSLRMILGNDVAIQAVKDNRTHPWPDGTMFAKIGWHQVVDSTGMVRPGTFAQVEFMKKDSKQYASTLGWGWGRWLGTELKPYAKDNPYAASCVGCHAPLRDTDFVFTMPIRTQP
jgi:mono/diheme cytochrome c family protein